MTQTVPQRTRPETKLEPLVAPWATLIPDDQWEVFIAGTSAIASRGIPQLLGGAMGLATYTRHWRNTKDVDLFVPPDRHEEAVAAVLGCGFADYFERERYDRSWIFRATRDGVIFDIIWALPNHRVAVDAPWFERGTPVQLRDRVFAAVPAEELIRIKLYVLQRERCDWVDVLNILAASCERIDWAWAVERMSRDLPLLHGALAVFNWMCPGRARALPAWLRTQFALPDADTDDAAATEERRVRLFDSRPWFAVHQPMDRILER